MGERVTMRSPVVKRCALYYEAPINPGNVLRYSSTTGDFAEYNEFEPRQQISYDANLPGGLPTGFVDGAPFVLNFLADEGEDMGVAGRHSLLQRRR